MDNRTNIPTTLLGTESIIRLIPGADPIMGVGTGTTAEWRAERVK